MRESDGMPAPVFLPGLKRGKVLISGKGTFCARSIILRALLCVIFHFEGTMGKITYLLT